MSDLVQVPQVDDWLELMRERFVGKTILADDRLASACSIFSKRVKLTIEKIEPDYLIVKTEDGSYILKEMSKYVRMKDYYSWLEANVVFEKKADLSALPHGRFLWIESNEGKTVIISENSRTVLEGFTFEDIRKYSNRAVKYHDFILYPSDNSAGLYLCKSATNQDIYFLSKGKMLIFPSAPVSSHSVLVLNTSHPCSDHEDPRFPADVLLEHLCDPNTKRVLSCIRK